MYFSYAAISKNMVFLHNDSINHIRDVGYGVIFDYNLEKTLTFFGGEQQEEK